MTDTPAFDPEALVEEVAFAMFVSSGEEETAETYAALDADTRDALTEVARAAIQTFTGAIKRVGVRLVPPGAVMVPHDAEEAAMMAHTAQQWFAAQKRKPGLIGSVSPGLVFPGGINGKRH